jgi:hypothetical protein
VFHTEDCISSGDTELTLSSEMNWESFLFSSPMISDNGRSALCGYPTGDNIFVNAAPREMPDVDYACKEKGN